MIYLFYGEEEFLIDSEIKKLISKNKIDSNSISRYDLEVDSIKSVIDDACTISLFDDKKFIIVYNFDKLVKDDEKSLSEFINNIGDVIIVFVASKLDDRKKIVKEIKKISTSKEFNKNKNISDTVRSMFDDYKVDYKTVDLLISMVGNDLRILSQEVEKLKIYKDDKKNHKFKNLTLKCSNSLGFIERRLLRKLKRFLLQKNLIKIKILVIL